MYAKRRGVSDIISTVMVLLIISVAGGTLYAYSIDFFQRDSNQYLIKTELEINQNKEQFKIIDIWDNEDFLNLTIYNHGSIDITISDVYFDGIRVKLFLFGRGEEITSESLHKIGSRGEKSIDYWKSNHTN